MKKLLLSVGILGCVSAMAGENEASVAVLRGTAKTQTGQALKVNDKVIAGTTIKTEARSFVKLLFKDNSQMSIGPDTTLKLEPSKAGDPSLVNLVGGQLRAKVQKDLLKGNEGATKDKLLIKTRTAAMGVRGTDFNVSFNQLNAVTALITFEGMVAMARMDGNITPAAALAENPQRVGAGQFSGANPSSDQPSIPVKISPAQLESLRGNDSFQGLGEKGGQKVEAQASAMPPGVDPRAFASGTDKNVAEAFAKTIGESAMAQADKAASGGAESSAKPEGSFDKATGEYAPRAGGFIDLASGLYVPPPPGSAFDPNTGVYTPPLAMGGVDPATGLYVPPKGVELDPVKGFVASESPSSDVAGAGAAPPPPPAVMALVEIMNAAVNPENAGKEVSFEMAFAPSAGGPGSGFVPPPPPPIGPPPPPPGSAPPPDEPVEDAFCPTCISDNVNQIPNSTPVRFQLNVQ